MGKYRYRPLPQTFGTSSVRLATIHPGVGDDEVVVTLRIEPFTVCHPPKYEALSYAWGSTKSPRVIYVGLSDRATLRVTTGLRVALQHLRYPHQERVVWVDAICIDQANDREKGPQVAMMGQLFECASRVVVWLGPEGHGSAVAMERLAYIGSQIDVHWGGMHRISPAADVEGVDRSIADPNTGLPMDTEQWLAVASLLHRRWFDRLWIRQEIFVAEAEAVVCCGPHHMPWPTFRKALRLFYAKGPELGQSAWHGLRDRLSTIGGLVFQMRWTDILSIRETFGRAVCSDPRDYIYGIRALLLREQQDLCGTPDYTKSSAEVYSSLARAYITKYPDGLTILCFCELSPLSRRWSGPSWVPDWSTNTSSRWSWFDTRASSQIRGWFAFLPPLGTLRVLGVSRTVVQEVRSIPKFYHRDWNTGVAFVRSIAPHELNADYPSGGTLLRALARTLAYGAISDFMHTPDGNYPTSAIAEAVVARILSGIDLVKEDHTMGSDTQRFLKRMDFGSGGRMFIQCTNGYMGIAPPSTRAGDEIFVVVGCQRPLVLRSRPGGESRYVVVGECYVEGLARGEPLLGSLPDHIGFSVVRNQTAPRVSRCFRDLRSGELFREDPRLGSLGVDLGEFRTRLAEDPQATISLEPDVLLDRIKGLGYVDLV